MKFIYFIVVIVLLKINTKSIHGCIEISRNDDMLFRDIRNEK
ncbi:MAG: hypothetical protein N3D17_05275 [bacterium]|nr:hypothetical protein [bacterium]